jgi:hypothetical protein
MWRAENQAKQDLDYYKIALTASASRPALMLHRAGNDTVQVSFRPLSTDAIEREITSDSFWLSEHLLVANPTVSICRGCEQTFQPMYLFRLNVMSE